MFNRFTPSLVRALGVFIVVLLSSIITVSASYIYMDGIYQDQMTAQRAMRVWKSKIDSSVQKNQIIDEYEKNFLKLVQQGVVGAEDRLSWFETVQQTAKKRGMPLVKYSISSQEALNERNLKREYRGINVYKSSMMLDAKMGHEGDLFALLNDLKKADGLYTVDKCNIEKISIELIDSNNNMKAVCELGWYTFRGSKTDQGNKDAG
jgi:hypothetical protein